MKKSIIVGFLLTVFFNLYGQNQADSITVKNRLGPVFQQNGKNLTPNKLLTITKSNLEAYSEMKIANNNYLASMVFQLPGGFLIGYPIGAALAGGDPNWDTVQQLELVLLFFFSIPSIHFSVHICNKSCKKCSVPFIIRDLNTLSIVRPDFKLGITYNGDRN